MKVNEIMKRQIITVTPATSFREIATLMINNRITAIPVVDERGTVVGIIAERDLLRELYPSYQEVFDDDASIPIWYQSFEEMEDRARNVAGMVATELMHRRPVTTTPDTPILRAGTMMLAKRLRRLPVIEDGKLIGMVSMGDVFRAVAKKQFGLKEAGKSEGRAGTGPLGITHPAGQPAPANTQNVK